MEIINVNKSQFSQYGYLEGSTLYLYDKYPDDVDSRNCEKVNYVVTKSDNNLHVSADFFQVDFSFNDIIDKVHINSIERQFVRTHKPFFGKDYKYIPGGWFYLKKRLNRTIILSNWKIVDKRINK